MTKGVDENRKAVSCGYWPLYRYNPALVAEGKNPLQLDSKSPTTSFEDYAYGENRYKVLQKNNPAAAAILMKRQRPGRQAASSTIRNLPPSVSRIRPRSNCCRENI